MPSLEQPDRPTLEDHVHRPQSVGSHKSMLRAVGIRRLQHQHVGDHPVVDVTAESRLAGLVEDHGFGFLFTVEGALEALDRRYRIKVVFDVVAIGKTHHRSGTNRRDERGVHLVDQVDHRVGGRARWWHTVDRHGINHGIAYWFALVFAHTDTLLGGAGRFRQRRNTNHDGDAQTRIWSHVFLPL